MKIYLIRHGRQNSDLCNVDVPLCKEGIIQAELTADRLKKYDIDALYSSNLIRAVETAEIINRQLKVSHTIDERLKEIDFGGLTGLSGVEIIEQYGEFVKEREATTSDVAFPAGKDGIQGENGDMVYLRAKNAIDDIIKSEYNNVAIVTHGGLIRASLAGILGIDMAKKLMFAKDLENCSITQINYYESSRRFTVERINDYAHLENNEELLRKHFKRSL